LPQILRLRSGQGISPKLLGPGKVIQWRRYRTDRQFRTNQLQNQLNRAENP
jgi:hypothetical protein